MFAKAKYQAIGNWFGRQAYAQHKPTVARQYNLRQYRAACWAKASATMLLFSQLPLLSGADAEHGTPDQGLWQ